MNKESNSSLMIRNNISIKFFFYFNASWFFYHVLCDRIFHENIEDDKNKFFEITIDGINWVKNNSEIYLSLNNNKLIQIEW
jgi:hypothetical protein